MSEPVTCMMPVKNGLPYLRQTLASIESQTYPYIRVLAWDNGSTDGTVEELNRWMPSRIAGRVISDRPMRLGASRAQMVLMATTELCACVDADDISLPDRLERQVKFMRTHPEVAAVGANMQMIDEHEVDLPGMWVFPERDCDIRWRLRFCNAINQPTVMFRRSAALAVGNYRDIKPGQDYDLWLRLAERFQLANLSDRLVRYRRHAASIGSIYAGQSSRIVREIACSNAERLFPGVPAQEAIRLRDLVSPEKNTTVRLRDVWRFHRAATLAARQIRERDNYFRATALYRQQFKGLALRWLKRQPGAAAVWPVLGRAWRALAGSHPVGGLHHEVG